MTIDEKRDYLNNYCFCKRSCANCVLNSTKAEWIKLFRVKEINCLDITQAPESDLDKAIEMIKESENNNE